MAYLPYIVLGAGLNRGWRDFFYSYIFFLGILLFLCSWWDGRKLGGGFLTRRDETNCTCSLVRSGVTTTTYYVLVAKKFSLHRGSLHTARTQKATSLFLLSYQIFLIFFSSLFLLSLFPLPAARRLVTMMSG